MFLGEYQHSLDAKGRVILPARFREQLEGGAVMARSLDGCLAVYTLEEFDRVAQKLTTARERGARERQAARSFFAGTDRVVPDAQGRVPVRPELREYAGLDRDVTVVGGYDHIEIWDRERFRQRDAEGIAAIEAGEGIEDFM
ncbi:MAG TPA: division/cell wall cluster transcriptional repressor MraZ [Acidimicrobiia bacterium]|jgi:MraZ protein|nr:division/cell wall cluster transcriptional repressor MraZ [Acidimicrobiia bacterium]